MHARNAAPAGARAPPSFSPPNAPTPHTHTHTRSLIKEFERDARAAGMPPRDLADRKRALVTELNSLIALRKGYASADEARGELLAGAGGAAGRQQQQQQQAGASGDPYEGVSVQELVKQGRRGMQEADATLGRAEKLVEDTLQIGQQVCVVVCL